MAITQASFKIAHAGASAIIKIEGRANCNSTDGFNQVIDQEIREGCRNFILDLSECIIMDTSFLGTSQDCIQVELFDASERILELMEDLGALPLFQILKTDDEPSVSFKEVSLNTNCDKLTLLKNSIQAHETLLQCITKLEKKASIESLIKMLKIELEAEENK